MYYIFNLYVLPMYNNIINYCNSNNNIIKYTLDNMYENILYPLQWSKLDTYYTIK